MVTEEASKAKEQVENKKLRDYELVLIISPEVLDEKFEATLDNISKFITERGGIISNINRWGKKRFTYSIKHFVEGNYVLVRFKLESKFNKELDTSLQLSEGVLRHLLIKVD